MLSCFEDKCHSELRGPKSKLTTHTLMLNLLCCEVDREAQRSQCSQSPPGGILCASTAVVRPEVAATAFKAKLATTLDHILLGASTAASHQEPNCLPQFPQLFWQAPQLHILVQVGTKSFRRQMLSGAGMGSHFLPGRVQET